MSNPHLLALPLIVLSTKLFHILLVKRNIMSYSPSCWPSNLSWFCGFIAKQPSGSVCPSVLLLTELSSSLKLLLTQFFSTKWACDSLDLLKGLSYCFINQTLVICLIFSTCLSQSPSAFHHLSYPKATSRCPILFCYSQGIILVLVLGGLKKKVNLLTGLCLSPFYRCASFLWCERVVLGDSYLIQLLTCKDLTVVAFWKRSLGFSKSFHTNDNVFPQQSARRANCYTGYVYCVFSIFPGLLRTGNQFHGKDTCSFCWYFHLLWATD